MTPDVAGVISLYRFMAPVDDNVTTNTKHQSTKAPKEGEKAPAAGLPLSGFIHAAFLPMQGVCAVPAPRRQRA